MTSEPSASHPVDPSLVRIDVPYRVRFDESTPTGTIRSSVCLRYIQDVAWVHSVRLGFGREWYAERGLWWLVRVADLEFLAPIDAYATLSVSTQVTGWRRVSARRESTIEDAGGRLVARAAIDWVITNDRGVPTRLPPELETLFPSVSATYQPNRVTLPPTPETASRLALTVRPQELDPMAHANNTVYLDWFEEALIAAGEGAAIEATSRRYRLEYLRPAAPGARVTGAVWPRDGGWSYRLTDSSGAEMLRATLSLPGG